MNHLFPYIERALLHPAVRIAEQYEALDDLTQLGLAGLTVAPFWVKKWRREMGDNHPASLTAVIGYPFGYQRTEAKQLELELALQDGATALEVVINHSAFYSSSSFWVKIELVKLVSMAHAHEKLITVVLETSLYSPDDQAKLIRLAADAGADYLKNATAALPAPFITEACLLFRQRVPASVGVKVVADGASQQAMEQLIDARVERLALSHPLPFPS